MSNPRFTMPLYMDGQQYIPSQDGTAMIRTGGLTGGQRAPCHDHNAIAAWISILVFGHQAMTAAERYECHRKGVA